MKFNLNSASVAERDFTSSRDVIPDDTEALLLIDVVKSKESDDNYDEESDGWLTLSNKGDSASLVLEFTVVGGEFNKRKFWERLYLRGDSKQAIDIALTKIRAIVEGARGISPVDMSPAAQKKRDIELEDIHKMEIRAVIGIEKGNGKNPKGEPYPDKNVLKRVLNDAAPPNGKAVVSSKPKQGAASEKRRAAFAE